MPRLELSGRITLLVAANVVVAVLLALLADRFVRAIGWQGSFLVAAGIALLFAFAVALWTSRLVAHRITGSLTAMGDGVRGFRDGDYSLRLNPGGDDEVTDLVGLYNDVGEVLRTQRNDIYQKELLLDTILQRTPIGVVLVGPAARVVYSNAAARDLLSEGARLDGRAFADIIATLVDPLREALASEGNALVTVPAGEQEETFHLTQRAFRLNTQAHRLVLLERLTPELRRQEVAVWKKAIRLMNHELNNSIAPISSLFHSARTVQQRPDQLHKLGEIYATIEERLAYLRSFLESYAQFARLPVPRKERVPWRALLDDVHALYPFHLRGEPPPEGLFDRAQMQQVLINLVKNAHESGSAADEIAITIDRIDSQTRLRVLDRGRGLDEAVIRQALLPFYSTKADGTGIGLALSNEILEAHGGRLHLQAREGGGAIVTCWLPG